MNEAIALISIITALFAVILGPLVSMWVAQKQARVSVLSTNRQAWINNLRDQVSEFISICALFHAGDWTNRADNEFDDKFERLVLVESKIILMLNPNEKDHNRLSDLLAQARMSLGSRAKDIENRRFKEWGSAYKEIVPLTQSILKSEWIRVKKTQ